MKINFNIQKIVKSPFFYVVSTIFMILIIVTLTSSDKTIPAKNSPGDTVPLIPVKQTITPIIGPIVLENSLIDTPVKIEWTTTNLVIPESLNTYHVNKNFVDISNSENISQRFGFKKTEEEEAIDENFKVWSNDESVLTQNFIDNELIFISGKTPQLTNQSNTESIYINTAENFIQNLLGKKTQSNLLIQSINYFGSDSSNLKDDTSANIIQISYYQTIDNYPLTINTQSGAPVNIVLDKKLNLINMSAKGLFEEVENLGSKRTTQLSTQIKNSNLTATRINTSNNDDIDNSIVTLKNVVLKQHKAQLSYFSINNQLVPVFLIEGTLKGSDNLEQKGLYIINTIEK